MSHEITEQLKTPKNWLSRADLLTRPSPVPRVQGIYAWYLSNIPGGFDLGVQHVHQDHKLVYVGVAPGRPNAEGELHQRLRIHCRGKLRRSTFRRTVAAMLTLGPSPPSEYAAMLDSPAPAGALNDMVSQWMERHARVCWLEVADPWQVEPGVISALTPPLNIKDNPNNPFRSELMRLRQVLASVLSPPCPKGAR